MQIKFVCILFLFFSCKTFKNYDERFEVAYNEITKKSKDSTPFLSEFGSDASGTKIMSEVYEYKGVYKNLLDFNKNNKSKKLKVLAAKYTRKNWREDAEFKLLMPEEIKNFHGPLDYIYFSTIKNDTLKAQILGNPNGKYELTTVTNYLIVFDKNKIKSLKEWKDSYD